jgi:predicted enzyme related to lactoylglutathione lyase
MTSPIALVEFPADDPDRARSFWGGLLEVELAPRTVGEGWQTTGDGPAVGVHSRGRGPGDSFSLPYFNVGDMQRALEQVGSLGGSVVHPDDTWSVCRDPEGNPFGLTVAPHD